MIYIRSKINSQSTSHVLLRDCPCNDLNDGRDPLICSNGGLIDSVWLIKGFVKEFWTICNAIFSLLSLFIGNGIWSSSVDLEILGIVNRWEPFCFIELSCLRLSVCFNFACSISCRFVSARTRWNGRVWIIPVRSFLFNTKYVFNGIEPLVITFGRSWTS